MYIATRNVGSNNYYLYYMCSLQIKSSVQIMDFLIPLRHLREIFSETEFHSNIICFLYLIANSLQLRISTNVGIYLFNLPLVSTKHISLDISENYKLFLLTLAYWFVFLTVIRRYICSVVICMALWKKRLEFCLFWFDFPWDWRRI
jgi:hypothetical protein